ncbi:hypothetical protein [Pseudomonas sp. O230]|uniref:hypothetical protein n=1 Tax=Pseudomonas sp. O230 TaxID=3159450 RepID=UPI00387B6DC0
MNDAFIQKTRVIVNLHRRIAARSELAPAGGFCCSICIGVYFCALILHNVTQVPDQDTSALHGSEKVGHIAASDICDKHRR